MDKVYSLTLDVGREVRELVEAAFDLAPVVGVLPTSFAARLEAWLTTLKADYADRALPVDAAVADVWGAFDRQRVPLEPDGLIAATALRHGTILVTRNLDHVAGTGVATLNPWGWG